MSVANQAFLVPSTKPSVQAPVQTVRLQVEARAASQPAGSSSILSTSSVVAGAPALFALRAVGRRNRKVARQARGGELTRADLEKDLVTLVKKHNCGPILIRLSWHDAGVFSDGKLKGGCPNAAMRFTDGGEGTFGANAGLPEFANGLLKPITDKYCPAVCSVADLWALAANVGIKEMGGPDIPTKFGRKDAASSSESVESEVGRLPDGDKGIDHLRDIFHPKGFDDKAIVALSGAHTVGRCYADRSGFEGPWTEEPYKFDNSYFKEMLSKTYTPETTAAGKPQNRSESGTIMLISDLALLTDPAFKEHVETYAKDQDAYFKDFTDAWVKMQELGYDL
uniref:Plant heme peroxidase family profile domain-containing protein n=1 Tax=Pyrodinium bahamense TaxID=73915 RepID=A0A7S0AMK7_9DINO|eukprot:CAMPEP_0179060858 /NCGR_PEP_ID=MMETSP0796-20121207/26081_1 /TAXON_ID=73915 /ORGANISM="Pyrodinium bahamense, Strain pbaha01" /LENGTH=337 /DNA_ID=CAMNT_0020757651 /DNA_START=87 /DNA_END=1100 /DNA_ORIENTATION=-